MKVELKKRITAIEKEQGTLDWQHIPIPSDYGTSREARAAYARTMGMDPDVMEAARERILARYAVSSEEVSNPSDE